MRYLQRDTTGTVLGHYANPQPGYAEEEVPDDHPDLQAWEAKRAADMTRVRPHPLEQEVADLKAQVAALLAKLG